MHLLNADYTSSKVVIRHVMLIFMSMLQGMFRLNKFTYKTPTGFLFKEKVWKKIVVKWTHESGKKRKRKRRRGEDAGEERRRKREEGMIEVKRNRRKKKEEKRKREKKEKPQTKREKMKKKKKKFSYLSVLFHRWNNTVHVCQNL